jgi:hypothetical protein
MSRSSFRLAHRLFTNFHFFPERSEKSSASSLASSLPTILSPTTTTTPGKSQSTAANASATPSSLAKVSAEIAVTEKSRDEIVGKMSRGQMKRAVKREQYLKKLSVINSSLKLTSSAKKVSTAEERRKKAANLGGFDDLKEALLENNDGDESGSSDKNTNGFMTQQRVSTNKGKKLVAVNELNHLQNVLSNPSFIENPFAAIARHLENSLPVPEDQSGKSEGGRKKEGEKAKERNELERQKAEDARAAMKKNRMRNRGGGGGNGSTPGLGGISRKSQGSVKVARKGTGNGRTIGRR